jgi:hypothetical protein
VLRERYYAQPRFSLIVLVAFAAIGLLLVAVGVCGDLLRAGRPCCTHRPGRGAQAGLRALDSSFATFFGIAAPENRIGVQSPGHQMTVSV